MRKQTETDLAYLVSTWFGCGLSPYAPGTAGSLGGLAVAIPLHHFFGFTEWRFLLLAAVLFPLSVWAATRTARALQKKDPGVVVVDEVVGQWIALAGAHTFSWRTYLVAFALFRVFDIWKPWPTRQLEALPEGLGIVVDDVMAGCYAALVLLLAGAVGLV